MSIGSPTMTSTRPGRGAREVRGSIANVPRIVTGTIGTPALSAILNAFFIGLFFDDPDRRITITREFELQRAASARDARATKPAPEKKKTLDAGREAMEATASKPKRSEQYARLIQPTVSQLLGRELSPWQIRARVRVILKEAPEKSD